MGMSTCGPTLTFMTTNMYLIIRNYWGLNQLSSWEGAVINCPVRCAPLPRPHLTGQFITGAVWIICRPTPYFLFSAALPPYFHFFPEPLCIFLQDHPGKHIFGGLPPPFVLICLSTEVAVLRVYTLWDDTVSVQLNLAGATPKLDTQLIPTSGVRTGLVKKVWKVCNSEPREGCTRIV